MANGLMVVHANKTLLSYYKYGSALNTAHKKSTLGDKLRCVAAWRDLLVAGTVTGGIRLWDSKSGEMTVCFPAHSTSVTAIDIGENTVLTGGEDGLVFEFPLSDLYSEVTQPRYTYSHHTMTISRVSICGQRRFSASMDHSICVMRDGEVVSRYDCGSGLSALAGDSEFIYGGGVDGTLYRVYPPADLVKWQSQGIAGLALLADGRHLLVACDYVYLLSTATSERLKVFKFQKGPIDCMLLINRPSALTSIEDSHEPINPLAKTVDGSLRHPVLLKPCILPPPPLPASMEEHKSNTAPVAQKLHQRNQHMFSAWTSTWS